MFNIRQHFVNILLPYGIVPNIESDVYKLMTMLNQYNGSVVKILTQLESLIRNFTSGSYLMDSESRPGIVGFFFQISIP